MNNIVLYNKVLADSGNQFEPEKVIIDNKIVPADKFKLIPDK